VTAIARGLALGVLLASAAVAAGDPAPAAAPRPDVPAPARLRGVDPADLAHTYTIGAFVPEFEPPPPGTYALPVVDEVSDHPLLDADGRATTLFAETGGRVAVVAFIYASCGEVAGCPLGTAVLHRLDGDIAADPALAGRVTLLTVSFDPERDTPARMAEMRALHTPRARWRFATTRGDAQLAPLLADFDQPVAKLRFEDGTWTGLYRHVLKVYLLDARHRVRNVYSTGFLHAPLVLNDVRTVLSESAVH
jgi:cytochrome c peroxidase